ncbi:DUF6907 domain-containing protein [Streptomyces sp. CA2R106]|uniref:DUF6907 domain-containing protein n=1 Tax=Streptomyces sp. CA2R106 TaxID=3120153 RepID=UPI0030080095
MRADEEAPAAKELRTSGEPRTWRVTATNGVTVSGYLPPWAYEDPSESDVHPVALPVGLARLELFRYFDGVPGSLVGPGDGTDEDGYTTPFGALTCHPCADRETPDRPVHPVLTIQVSDTEETVCTDPDELAALITRLRAHTDYLDQHVRPAFTTIREDWRTHHRAVTEEVSRSGARRPLSPGVATYCRSRDQPTTGVGSGDGISAAEGTVTA